MFELSTWKSLVTLTKQFWLNSGDKCLIGVSPTAGKKKKGGGGQGAVFVDRNTLVEKETW